MEYGWWWPVLGMLLVTSALRDFGKTTLSIGSSGWFSLNLSRLVWCGLLTVHRRYGARRLLAAAGPAITLLLIALWFCACWLGWTLVFSASATTLVDADTLVAAKVSDRLYYAGFTLTTLGYGDFKTPHTPGQIASVVAGFNGIFLITLAVTYITPVLTAVNDRRALALQIHALGENPVRILHRGKGEGDYSLLASQLQQLESAVAIVTQKHLAYPVVHYYYTYDRKLNLALRLASLDEALNVLRAGPDALSTTVRFRLETMQVLIGKFLEVVQDSYLPWGDNTVPVPNVEGEAPDAEDGPVAIDLRRRQLHAYVLHDGWQWKDVYRQ